MILKRNSIEIIMQTINLKELGVKAQSKIEVYNLLIGEGNFYLPPPKETPYKFLAQICRGEKLVRDLEEIF